MKFKKLSIIFFNTLLVFTMVYSFNQAYTINKLNEKTNILTKENKEIKGSSKELKKTIDRMNKNIVSLEHELEKKGSFNSFVYFNPNNITELSGVTYEQLSYALKDTKLSTCIDSFLTVEKHYNINSLVMIGIVANESAWLTSNRTLKQNNVTGYAVYSDNSKGASFSSIDESILKTAELLCKDYIDPQGRFYKGLSISNVNEMYSSDSEWDNTVESIATQIKDRINNVVEVINE